MVAASSPVLTAALRWCERGAAPIPVRFRDKVPIGEAWQKQRITSADASVAFAAEPVNIGVLWGAPSHDLVDVDLDWPEACAIAPALLPKTAVYGRASAHGSHWLFRVENAVTRQWTLPPALAQGERRAVVLELRAEGAQSVVPPSVHPSGELYEWVHEPKPCAIHHEDLVRRLNLLAAGAVLVQFWREGARHKLALALAGAMLSSGYAADEVENLIIGVAQAAGDVEARDRARAVQSSAAACAAGRPATGVPKLAELIGEPAVAVLKRWLGLANALPMNTHSSAAAWPIDEGESVLNVCTVATIEEKPMHWLWPNRIARGKLHMLAGEPGLSKSVLTCALAGIVTSGGTWPLDDTRCERGDVLMLNVEDDPADTIRPRLRAAGADLARVARNGIVAPKIRWHDVPEMRSANEVLAPRPPIGEKQDQVAAEAWLRERLAAGPVPVRELRADADVEVAVSWRTVERIAHALGVVGDGEKRSRTWALPSAVEPTRQNDKMTKRQPDSVPNADIKPAEAATRQDTSHSRVGGLSLCRVDALPSAQAPDAAEADGNALPVPVSQQTLLKPVTEPQLPACTSCAQLNIGGFCSHYQRVLPEPSRPTSCIHFEQRPPDTPWE